MNRQALNIFHSVYYGLVSGAIFLMVWKSWLYGFFFTPFPAILTGTFLLYVGAAAISVCDIFRRVPWLGTPLSADSILGKLPRKLALLFPILPFLYLGSSGIVRCTFDSSPPSVQRAEAMISVNGVLYGPKRAERSMRRFARRAQAMQRFDVADQFLTQNLDSVRRHNRSPQDVADAVTRVVDNHINLRASRAAHQKLDMENAL